MLTTVHSGPGLIERPAQLRNPRFGREQDKDKFAAISRFVQRLFEDADAAIGLLPD